MKISQRTRIPVRSIICFTILVLSTATQGQDRLGRGASAQDTVTILIGGSGSDSGVAFHQLQDGDLIAVLTTDSPDLPTTDGAVQSEFAGGLADAYLIRFSTSTMEIKWATYYGADGFDAPHGMECFDDLDMCVVVGEASGPLPGAGTGKGSQTGPDSWAAAFDMTSGELRWVTQLFRDGVQWFEGVLSCPVPSIGTK